MLDHNAQIETPLALPDPVSSYLRDVLVLMDGEVEGDLDARLRAEAKDLGLDAESYMQTLRPPTAPKPYSANIARRSQESIFSRASHSTGLTSNFSDGSRDQHRVPGEPRSRTSLSIRDYDAFLARATPNGRHSLSFSPPSTPSQSTFSLPLSSPGASPKKYFRRIRALSMLRLSRNGSASSLTDRCPHCAQDPMSLRRAVHKLPCGHRLCTQALRETIHTATEGETGAVPSCCGIPIPGKLIEHGMTQAEQDTFLERVEYWNDLASNGPSSRRDSVATGIASQAATVSERSRSYSRNSNVESLLPKMGKDLERIMDLPDFQSIRQSQTELNNRFAIWIDEQRDHLNKQNLKAHKDLKLRHEEAIENLMDHHIVALAEAEDKQVKAEADLRELHEQEIRDHATALRHMEAYCAGTISSTGESHGRTVTEQDHIELAKRREARTQFEAKHANAINVLRGEQSRRMRTRELRQQKELSDLRRTHLAEEVDCDRAGAQILSDLDSDVVEKRMRIRGRWQLQIALFVKKLEAGEVAGGGHVSVSSLPVQLLPPFDWQNLMLEKNETTPLIIADTEGKPGDAIVLSTSGFAAVGRAV